MKGSAKWRRTRWTFVMKLSVATVAGSTSRKSQTESVIVYIAGGHTLKPVLFKFRDMTREKYASTASRLSGEARTMELKI